MAVARLPRGGRLVGEVQNVAIVVEREILRVSVTSEKIENPLLLFGGQQLLAAVVAVIGTMTTKISLHLALQIC